MKFARIVERGNRQVLLSTDLALDGNGYIVVIETSYQGDQFFSLCIEGFTTRQEAYDAMMTLTDDEIMSNILNDIDYVLEDDEQ